MKKLTHKLHILKTLLESDVKLTATDFHYISNGNQFFAELEHQNLISSEWGEYGDARVKFRFVAEHQREKAQKFLISHGLNAVGD